MLHSSLLKGWAGRGALSLALLVGAMVVFLMGGGLGEGQETVTCPDTGTADGAVCIEFPEHGSGTVAAYTAVDPEGEDVVWSRAPASTDGSEDRASFSIDETTGVLTFITPPDFEAPTDSGTPDNIYNVIIQATDDSSQDAERAVGRAPSRTRTLAVIVQNVEEAGEVTLGTLQPQEDVPISAMLIDPDGPPRDSDGTRSRNDTDLTALTASTNWQWSRSARATGPWTDIEDDGDTENLTEGQTPTYEPTDDDVGMYLRATATYGDGEGEDKSAHAISANPVQADPANKAPSFLNEEGETTTRTNRSVVENAAVGTAVGAPVTATDPGPDGQQETLTYGLSASNMIPFDVDSRTGQIRVKGELDADKQTTYSLTITATDPSGLPATITVTVTVTDVDEAPTIASPTQDAGRVSVEVEEGTPADTEVSTYSATDPDGDDPRSLKWTLSGRDADRFWIGNYSNPDDERGSLYFRESPDYEAPTDSGGDNVYNVTVEVTDRGGNKATRDVTVSVRNLDEDGLLTVSNWNPQVGTGITATLTDPDTPISNVVWTWKVRDTEVSSSNSYTPKTADVGRVLVVEVSYTDGTGDKQDDSENLGGVVERPTGSNDSPRFSSSADTRLTVLENKDAKAEVGTVTATDPDLDDLTYSLSGGDGAFSIDQDTGEIVTRTTLDREKRASYRVTITAEDPSGARATHSLTIDVTDVNEPPAITSGDAPFIYYAENSRDIVATFRAEDPEGSRIVWSLGGTDLEHFTLRNGVLRFSSSPDFKMKSEYSVDIKAGDGTDDGVDEETVIIEIVNVDEPGTLTFKHQPREGTAVTATLDDPDGSTSMEDWQWARSSSRSGPFTDIDIDGTPTSIYTPREDEVNKYLRATVTYTDEQGAGKTASVVSRARTGHKASGAPKFLADDGAEMMAEDGDNDNAFETTGTISREIAENAGTMARVGDPVVAVDIGDTGRQENLTYALGGTGSLADTGVDNDKFVIDSGGQIRISRDFTPDREGTIGATSSDNCVTLNECVVTVMATDPSRNSNTVRVNIEITNVNESPILSLPTPPTATAGVTGGALNTGFRHPEPVLVATNSESGETTPIMTVVFTADDPETAAADDSGALEWTLSGPDADDFVIGNNPDTNDTETAGTLTFKSGPDFEAPTDSGRNNGYDVTVQVTDDGGNTASKRVRITVINEGEEGTIALSHTQPEVGALLTATLTDPDRPRSIRWQWYRGTVTLAADGSVEGNNGRCSDTVEAPCAINRATSDTHTPVADDDNSPLTVVASYTDGHGSGKTAISTTAAVQEEDTDNVAPEFQDADDERTTRTTRTVNENADSETTVTAADPAADNPVGATDCDVDPQSCAGANTDALVYTLSGTDARFFTIDPTDGEISVGPGTDLDYEARRSYRVTVRALDPSGESAQMTVTINVLDVDELPELLPKGLAVLGDGDILYEENGTGAVGQYTAAGPSAANAGWRLSGQDASDFSISRTGELTFRSAPNYESPADSARDNIYEVTVAARSGRVQDEVDVTVEVTNVEEEGAVALSPEQGNVGASITATLTDPDGDITGLDWEWERSMDGIVGWSGIPGATSSSYTSVAEDAGHYLRAVAYYSDGHGASKSATARTTAAMLVDDDGVVTLTPTRGQIGTVIAATLTDPDGGVTRVGWQWAWSSTGVSGWRDIAGATSATYTATADDVGSFLRATAEYNDGDGPNKSAYAVTSRAVVEDDDGVVTLSTTGPSVGETVTATLSDPDGGVEGETWQWASSSDGTSNWTDIAGATSATYTVAAGDLGNFLRATVNYGDAAGAGKSAEAVTAAGVTVDDDGSVVLSPTGPSDGDLVTARLMDPDGGVTGDTWQWASSADGASGWMDILNAKSSTYTPITTDVGRYLRATVDYTDAVGPGKSAEAVTSSAVTADDDGSLTLSNTTPTVGETVTATLSDPDGGVTVEGWQWAISPNGTSNWESLPNATSSSYTPTAANVGSYLRATASYTDAVGPNKSAEAVTAVAVSEDDDGRVSLSTSTPEVGSAVWATLSDPDGVVAGPTWQWAKSSDGATWTDITGATSASYTPGRSDAGLFLRATASYDDGVGTGKSARAATSAGVAQMALLSEYDANGDGSIERSEAVQAVSDYFSGEISKDDMLAVLVLYFSN